MITDRVALTHSQPGPFDIGLSQPDLTLRGLPPDLKIAFVSSNVPRRCGIATFSADLIAAVKAAEPHVAHSVAAIAASNEVRLYGD